MSTKVIIFGPTGAVGSAATHAASEMGAHVVLAMRDPSKAIPGLSKEQEQAGKFERVQADSTKPETLSAAVSKTGAKHAFFYVDFSSPDGMKGVIETLKSSGIEFAVFLSSFSVQGDPSAIEPENLIAYSHAQTEVHLARIFGAGNYVAVRPAYYASNTTTWAPMIRKGQASIFAPSVQFDYIVQEDIGRVCGRLLAGGVSVSEGKDNVELCGPQLLSQGDAAVAIGKVLGIDVKVTADTWDDAMQKMVAGGQPKVFAEVLLKMMKETEALNRPRDYYLDGKHEAAVENIRKYGGGKEPIKFEDWAAANTHLFTA